MADAFPPGGQIMIFQSSGDALKRKNRLAQRKHRSKKLASNELRRASLEPQPSISNPMSPQQSIAASDDFQAIPQLTETYHPQTYEFPESRNSHVALPHQQHDQRVSEGHTHKTMHHSGHENPHFTHHRDMIDLGMFQTEQATGRAWSDFVDNEMLAPFQSGESAYDVADLHLGSLAPSTSGARRAFSAIHESPAESLSTFAPSSMVSDLSSSSNFDMSSIEDRVERVLDLVEELQFENMDELISLYYTATFKPGSLAQWAQSSSRTRRLSGFLATLHGSTQDWHSNEAQFYNDAMRRSAEQHYAQELSQHRKVEPNASATAAAAAAAATAAAEQRASLSEGEADGSDRVGYDWLSTRLQQLCVDEPVKRQLKRDKLYLREQIPDTWSLLSGLARSLQVPEPQGSQAAWVFLRLLNIVV